MKRLEIKTLRSKNFHCKPKHWWWPPARKTARLSLKVMESCRNEFAAEMHRRSMDLLLYGTAYCEKKYGVDLSSGGRG